MASPLNAMLASAIDVAIAEAEANKAQILDAAAKAEVNASNVAEKFIDAAIPAHGAIGLFRSSIVNAVNAEIAQLIAQSGNENDVLFGLLVSFAQAEAKKLAA